jgi:uncharacterized protein YgfB (UPF0149 family)
MGKERTAQEVLDDHLNTSLSGDVDDDVERNYAHDVTIVSNWGIEGGHAGVRRMAQLLQSQLPDCSFAYKMRLVEGELGMLEWSATSAAGSVDDGVDSYVIRDGRIQAQTIHYTLTPP